MSEEKKKFVTFSLLPKLSRKFVEHIKRQRYASIASFVRTSIFLQLDEERNQTESEQKKIHYGCTLPVDVPQEIDQQVKENLYNSRSSFARKAMINQIRRDKKRTEKILGGENF